MLSGHGTLYAFTVIHVSRPGHPAPYSVAYTDLVEGLRVFGQLDEWAAAAPGDPVRAYTASISSDPDSPPRIGVRFRTAPAVGVTTPTDAARPEHADA
jgi:uncharacterized OB-fold protein